MAFVSFGNNKQSPCQMKSGKSVCFNVNVKIFSTSCFFGPTKECFYFCSLTSPKGWTVQRKSKVGLMSRPPTKFVIFLYNLSLKQATSETIYKMYTNKLKQP